MLWWIKNPKKVSQPEQRSPERSRSTRTWLALLLQSWADVLCSLPAANSHLFVLQRDSPHGNSLQSGLFCTVPEQRLSVSHPLKDREGREAPENVWWFRTVELSSQMIEAEQNRPEQLAVGTQSIVVENSAWAAICFDWDQHTMLKLLFITQHDPTATHHD